MNGAPFFLVHTVVSLIFMKGTYWFMECCRRLQVISQTCQDVMMLGKQGFRKFGAALQVPANAVGGKYLQLFSLTEVPGLIGKRNLECCTGSCEPLSGVRACSVVRVVLPMHSWLVYLGRLPIDADRYRCGYLASSISSARVSTPSKDTPRSIEYVLLLCRCDLTTTRAMGYLILLHRHWV